MFKILDQSFRTGVVTTSFPRTAAQLSTHYRGAPEFQLESWTDARPAADVCPTGAIAISESDDLRRVTIDYGRCSFCGECAAASTDGAVRTSQEFRLAVGHRADLVTTAEYTLHRDGTHRQLTGLEPAEVLGQRVLRETHRVLGRSLAIRQVDAGSCNGCELEINALNNSIFDIERFGIHFVASPRHADMLLVTGPVTRNMERALRKTYDATPDPKLVVAVGVCGISGGQFGVNYATRGGVDQVVPVDVYIPGCPPRPEALLYGILLAIGRQGV
jgi:Ni,Fe-hydrogenase III small subunit/formate hydrogenlyase subunit 6/NADH:ubiquinone oxidoreductase subunit I